MNNERKTHTHKKRVIILLGAKRIYAIANGCGWWTYELDSVSVALLLWSVVIAINCRIDETQKSAAIIHCVCVCVEKRRWSWRSRRCDAVDCGDDDDDDYVGVCLYVCVIQRYRGGAYEGRILTGVTLWSRTTTIGGDISSETTKPTNNDQVLSHVNALNKYVWTGANIFFFLPVCV